MARSLFIEVEGEPIPQGSMRVFNGHITHASSRLKAWRKQIAEAIAALGEQPFSGAVRAWLYFRLPRPKTAKRPLPTVKPDVDKLARAVFDACEMAGIVRTDAQIVGFYADKRYAEELPPHVKIYLEELN